MILFPYWKPLLFNKEMLSFFIEKSTSLASRLKLHYVEVEPGRCNEFTGLQRGYQGEISASCG